MNDAPILQPRRIDPSATLPQRMTPLAAGLDLYACNPDLGVVEIPPGQRALVATGWAIAIARGHEGQVRPRSGLALRSGLTVLNAPGTIDADYRGELRVLLINLGLEPVRLEHGSRVAQLVIAPVMMVAAVEVESLAPSDPESGSEGRGAAGFGSTGR